MQEDDPRGSVPDWDGLFPSCMKVAKSNMLEKLFTGFMLTFLP